MEVSYDQARAANPSVIFVAVDRRFSEYEAQAISGACLYNYFAGPGEGATPRYFPTLYSEKCTGIYAAQAVCAALLAREKSKANQLGEAWIGPLESEDLGPIVPVRCL